MAMVINQYEVYLIDLDPTKGNEIQKERPWVVISPDEMNHTIGTVIIAPMTARSPAFPTRVELEFQDKRGWIVIDQIRTVDKVRLIRKIGKINEDEILKVKDVLREMLVD